jgi:hypothetical protein
LLEAGVNLKIVSERLRHAWAAITLDTCSHVHMKVEADVANTLDEMLQRQRREPTRIAQEA